MNDISLYEQIPVEERNFPITVFQEDSLFGIAAHWHEHYEIVYIKDGVCKVGCGGNIFPVKQDNIVIVNSNEIHFYEKSDDVLFLCIIINPSFFSDVNKENLTFKNFIQNDEFIKKCFHEIFLEFEGKNEGHDMAIKSITYKLITHILRNYKSEKIPERDNYVKNSKLKRITDVLRYIDEHYSEKLTTSLLSRRFYVNEQYFCHFFKKETGLSAVSYINRYRVEKAAVLLKNTDLTVTEIAVHVGFGDANYFARVFKKYMGNNPRKFRNIH